MNKLIVRALVDRLYDPDDVSVGRYIPLFSDLRCPQLHELRYTPLCAAFLPSLLIKSGTDSRLKCIVSSSTGCNSCVSNCIKATSRRSMSLALPFASLVCKFWRHCFIFIYVLTLELLVASRVLRCFNDDNPGHAGLLLLANILVSGFEPFQNAPDEVLRKKPNALQWLVQNRGGYERKLPALEVAIISESKTFLSSSARR